MNKRVLLVSEVLCIDSWNWKSLSEYQYSRCQIAARLLDPVVLCPETNSSQFTAAVGCQNFSHTVVVLVFLLWRKCHLVLCVCPPGMSTSSDHKIFLVTLLFAVTSFQLSYSHCCFFTKWWQILAPQNMFSFYLPIPHLFSHVSASCHDLDMSF